MNYWFILYFIIIIIFIFLNINIIKANLEIVKVLKLQ